MTRVLLFLAATIWLPLLIFNPTPPASSHDLRIDNILMSNLNFELTKFGIPAALRAKIIQQEKERRLHPSGIVPLSVSPNAIIDAYPVPQATTNGVLLWIPTFCAEGQGCAFTWKCVGNCSSHWMIEPGIATTWTPLLPCPPFLLCTVLSRIAPSPDDTVVAFQPYASGIPPLPLSWDCI